MVLCEPRISVAVGPDTEPLTLEEAKDQLVLAPTFTADDGLLRGLITAARLQVEALTGRTLIETQLDLTFDDEVPVEIEVPRPPLLSVVSVKYLDGAGAEQTWGSSNYQSDIPKGEFAARGRIKPAYGLTWPTLGVGRYRTLTARVKAGYGPASTDVPRGLWQVIVLLVRAWYHGESTTIEGALAMLQPYKVHR